MSQKRPFLLPVQAKVIKRRFSGPPQSQRAMLVNVPRPVPMRARMSGARLPGVLRSRNSEVKALTVSEATAAPGGAALALNATGSILAVNEIAVGSSFFNRIGRKVEMKNVRFTGIINPINATRAAVTDYARIVLVYDRQANGALPSISDIFQDTEQNGTNTTNAGSGVNLNNRDRFAIIMDKRVQLPAATDTAGVMTNLWPTSFGSATDGTPGYIIDEFRKLKGLTTQYKADSAPAVIGDISTGSLLLVTFANNAAGSDVWAMNLWNVRLRFHDM